MSPTAARTSGWVAWSGVLEDYPLAAEKNGEPRKLTLGVAPSTACGPLAHLHAGAVWNGGVRLAQLVESGFLRERLAGKVVLELGAAAALPSLVLMARCLGATDDLARGYPSGLVISDYPSTELLQNITESVRRNAPELAAPFRPVPSDGSGAAAHDAEFADPHSAVALGERLRIVGHEWGGDVQCLLEAARALGASSSASSSAGFDAVLLADCMWREDAHEALLKTLHDVVSPEGEVWMAFCHHWPGAAAVDEHFFNLAATFGFVCEEVADVSRARMTSLFESEPQEVYVYRMCRSSAA
eukprot:TRINITY_DN9460_c0_g1_i1.p2 TRINITY_DN9460_c0_g1~~TRINITY_DN9460_c0_g1_i1.p2  ORF type:complete len:300 (+),score=68.84 TRINITY_DN9460_c0_g1_i1:98-997(+)